MTDDNVVLVGVDGSPESLAAVDWAVARAECQGWRVHILCAYSLPSFTTASLDGGYAALDDSAIRSGAQAVIDEAVERVKKAGVTVTSSLETGDPAGVLVDLSEEATLAVHEADPIIVDVPDLPIWVQEQPGMLESAMSFARRSGLDW